MNNIIKAKNKLKQKLSLNDYITPETPHTGSESKRHTGKPVKQYASKQLPKTAQQKSKESSRIKSPKLTSRKGAQQACIPVNQFAGDGKIKATYYLSEADNQALLDIFIRRLQEKQKTDKSALIAEAIRLLYKQEMK